MACLHTDLHFWSSRIASVNAADIAVHRYHSKTEDLSQYWASRKTWEESRDKTWILRNKKPEKLRDTLAETEDLLYTHQPVCVSWRSPKTFSVLIGNGVLLTCSISRSAYDVERFSIDKTICSKVTFEEEIFDGVIADTFLVCSFMGKSQLLFICLKKPISSHEDKFEKLSAADPKYSIVQIPNDSSDLVGRRLALNSRHSLVAVWLLPVDDRRLTSTKPSLQTPNIFVFSIQNGRLQFECSETTSTLITCHFSQTKPHYLYTVEEASADDGYSGVNTCLYEFVDSKIQKVAETHIWLEDCVCIAERNNSEDKLLLACRDGLLVLQDDNSRTLQPTPSQLDEPTAIRWHPADAIVLVGNRQGSIQCFDMALTSILLVIASDVPSPSVLIDTGKIIRSSSHLQFIYWSPSLTAGDGTACNDSALLVFSRGPLCLMCFQLGVLSRGHIGPLQLATEYINTGQVNSAVSILKRMNWNMQAKTCFAMTSLIMDYLLKAPLDSDKESLCEETLVTFLAPSQAIIDTVITQYKERINNMARRFFHLLLRYRRFEKAYLLAVDINNRDLFMDLHFLALEFGETALAQVSRRKAEQVHVDHLSASLEALEVRSISSGLSGSVSAISTDQIPLELRSTDEDTNDEQSTGRTHSATDSPSRSTGNNKDKASLEQAVKRNVTVVHFGVI
ncbi:WD repeat-containing and planar cell polarity effector protein fritz homolog isoform X2 [Corticium candelabrum]|uniref:WD repeat-containing and planar cell polarity effector protein fritz homolog isoform X2 n=1 Tax=Corticium candelabrum TaxID=121492 RepID=UPI002E269A4C|nr:WD repeat-containing and planar cell polarity effector protein fritz homolog isoform X2 [Corticium candelabrum]